jgi:hypothetical protein
MQTRHYAVCSTQSYPLVDPAPFRVATSATRKIEQAQTIHTSNTRVKLGLQPSLAWHATTTEQVNIRPYALSAINRRHDSRKRTMSKAGLAPDPHQLGLVIKRRRPVMIRVKKIPSPNFEARLTMVRQTYGHM